MQATNAGLANGIRATTVGARSGITIENRGDIDRVASTGNLTFGILAFTLGADSPISITHRGNIAVSSDTSDAYGLYGFSLGAGSPVRIDSGGGRIEVSSGGGDALGIFARTNGPNSSIAIVNSADIGATSATEEAWGIRAEIRGSATGTTSIRNTGDITATARRDATGLSIVHSASDLSLLIDNSGDVRASSADERAFGLYARVRGGTNSPITVINRGDVLASSESGTSYGVFVQNLADGSPAKIVNSGAARGEGPEGFGIFVSTFGLGSSVMIENAGRASGSLTGIYSYSYLDGNHQTKIINTGDICRRQRLGHKRGGRGQDQDLQCRQDHGLCGHDRSE